GPRGPAGGACRLDPRGRRIATTQAVRQQKPAGSLATPWDTRCANRAPPLVSEPAHLRLGSHISEGIERRDKSCSCDACVASRITRGFQEATQASQLQHKGASL